MPLRILLLLLLPLWGCEPTNSSSAVGQQSQSCDFLLIAHRGASGLRPEHTLAAYQVAMELGADFIEPDLVATRDGVLVARHEHALAQVEVDTAGRIVQVNGKPKVLERTTDVAQRAEFADRLRVQQVYGKTVAGWFSEDFTLKELKRLRAVERMPNLRPASAQFDGQFAVPTLAEIVALIKAYEAATGRAVGIYPETKTPTFFAEHARTVDGDSLQLDTPALLADELVRLDFTNPQRVFIQSFEVRPLLRLRRELLPERNLAIPLIQLFGDFSELRGASRPPADLADVTPTELRENYGLGFAMPASDGQVTYADLAADLAVVKSYADGVGPNWLNLVDFAQDGTLAANDFAARAHAVGLKVHPYTLRSEANFLPARFALTDANGEAVGFAGLLRWLQELGADGVFTDFTGQVRGLLGPPCR